MRLRIKRVYDRSAPEDGARLLIDRYWPRGLTKKRIAASTWLKELAPSIDLLQWLSSHPSNWNDFERKYRDELDANANAIQYVRDLIAAGPVTLLYFSRDAERLPVRVLAQYLVTPAELLNDARGTQPLPLWRPHAEQHELSEPLTSATRRGYRHL